MPERPQPQRDVLPVPDITPVGLTTYDAKDPDTAFPPIEPLRPPDGAPNVLIVLIDDVGFGASSAFGGPINTPNAERLAANGPQVQPLPHHGALLADARGAAHRPQPPHRRHGRHHRDRDVGARLQLDPPEHVRAARRDAEAERLLDGAVRQVPRGAGLGDEPDGPVRRTGRPGSGFEYFYGFIGGEAHQYYPAIYEGTIPVEPEKTPEEGYHFMADMTDKAIKWVRQQKALMPDKPFFAYFAPGRDACAAPRHARVGRQVQGRVRRRLGRAARADLRQAEGARGDPGGRGADAAPRGDPGLGRHAGGAEAGAAPPDGDLRRLPRVHRPPRRPADRRARRPRASSRTRSSTTSSATTAPRPRARSTAPSTR